MIPNNPYPDPEAKECGANWKDAYMHEAWGKCEKAYAKWITDNHAGWAMTGCAKIVITSADFETLKKLAEVQK